MYETLAIAAEAYHGSALAALRARFAEQPTDGVIPGEAAPSLYHCVVEHLVLSKTTCRRRPQLTSRLDMPSGGTMPDRFISRGFQGRRQPIPADRVPPGQYVTRDFPVLSAGPTPRTPLDQWSFTVDGLVRQTTTWTWDEFLALPASTYVADIHCVTKWSKLDTRWQGVDVDTLLERVELDPRGRFVLAYCDGGYTTNLPLEDVRGARRSSPTSTTASPRARARRPGPARRAAPLLLEEREVDPRPSAARARRARLLGGPRLPRSRRPLEGAAVPR